MFILTTDLPDSCVHAEADLLSVHHAVRRPEPWSEAAPQRASRHRRPLPHAEGYCYSQGQLLDPTSLGCRPQKVNTYRIRKRAVSRPLSLSQSFNPCFKSLVRTQCAVRNLSQKVSRLMSQCHIITPMSLVTHANRECIRLF